MCKFLRIGFASLVLVAMCALSAMAQSTTTGAINGTVTNPAKEVVRGATVTVKNNGTNKEATATSDDNGGFKVGNLEPGTYTVNANGSGFAPYINSSVIVEVGRSTTLDVGLSLQGVTGTVEVTAEAPVINTTQQDFSSNMNQTSINELPVNGSRWSNFALLTPGTVPDANFGLISFRGISGLLNNNTVDGGDNNQAFFSEERGRTRINYVISQSAIKEFQVNTSNYSAEYGRAAGGVTNAVTKSGTNSFHGDAFFYDRDNRLGARNPLGFITTFDPTTGAITRSGFKPVDKRYRFGGDIGGPIKKNKAFFFFNYDELRRNFPGLGIFSSPSYLTTVNTAATGAGLKAPTRALTDAQINSVLSFLNSETGPVPRVGNQRIFLPKVDWNINDKNTFTATYNRLRWQSPSGIQTQPTNTIGNTSFGDDFVNDDSINLRLASNFSANLINEARYQWSRDFEFENSRTPLAGEPLTAPAYPGTIAAGTRSPDVFLTNGIEFGVATFLERPKFPDERRNQFFDMVTMTKGSHTIKFGGDFNHVTEVADNLRFYAGSYSYSNINDFIIDYLNWKTPLFVGVNPVACSSSSRVAGKCYTSNYQQAFGGTAFSLATNDYNFFFQDDFRVNQRLTVNMGVRWEYQQFPKPFLANPGIPQSAKMPSDKNNFGPRIGFAWDVRGDGKDSVRGGYGLYFGRMGSSTIYNALVNTGMPGGQFQVSVSQAAGPVFPNTLATQPSNPTVGVQFFDRNFQLPMIHQADLVYEHEITRNTVVSGSLLLSFGQQLPTFVDTNLFNPFRSFGYTIVGGPFDGQVLQVPWFHGTQRPNGSFGAMTDIMSIVTSKYVAGVVQLNRRLTKGLQFQVNYTRSVSRDAGQSSTTFTATNSPYNAFDAIVGEEGRSNFDIPNKLIANAVWQPESKNKFLKDWTFSPIFAAYSGIPLNVVVSGSIPSPGITQDPACWPGAVTTNACSTPGGGVNGSGGAARFTLIPRNQYRLPKIWNLDMRISRRIRFKESQSLEFLIEGFNLFNRTQVTGENNSIYTVSSTSATCNAAHTLCTPATATLSPTLSSGISTFQQVNAAGGTLFRERQIQWAIRYAF
jgi:hypothetical protein